MAQGQRNPYDFSNPVRDLKFFAGREEELKEIAYYLDLSLSDSPKYTSLAFIGERASGKTSLLNVTELIADDKGCLAVKISLNKETTSNDILFFKELLDGIMTKGAQKGFYGGIKDKIYSSFRKMIDTFDVSADVPLLFGTVYVGLKKKENSAGIPQHVLIYDFKEISREAKERKVPTIVVLIDEGDLLAQNEMLLQKIRNVFTEVEGYILIISGTEKMFPIISNVFSPIPRFFKRINVQNFKTIKETEEGLLKPLNNAELEAFDRSCIGEIHALTTGNPYEINLMAHFMFRRWTEKKTNKIELSPEVLDNILIEIDRLREEKHHEILRKIRQYWPEKLDILVSLLEFPNVPKKWLSEYMLLRSIDTLQVSDVYFRKAATLDYIEQMEKDGAIIEADKKIKFGGDNFDLVYLKYFCASKGVLDTKNFLVGQSEDAIINLSHRLIESTFLKDFEEYRIHIKFDRNTTLGKGQQFLMGFKGVISDKRETILEISPKTDEEFYLGAPNSIRFRINVEWMKKGFVIQIKFKKPEDLEKLKLRLDMLQKKIGYIDYALLFKDEIAWNNESAYFARQGKITEALERLDKAIEINSTFELPWLNKAGLFRNIGRNDEALECVNRALELRKSFPDVLKIKGIILINLGRNEEAVDSLNKAIEINLTDLEAHVYKAKALYIIGKTEQALDTIDKAAKIAPENANVLHARASILLELKKPNEAIFDIDKALNNAPENITLLNLKAITLGSMEKNKEAIEICDKLLLINPESGETLYNKACFESKEGNSEVALNCLKKAIELNKSIIEIAKDEKDFANIRNEERFTKLLNLETES